MARPHSGPPRIKHRSYESDYASENGDDRPRGFRGGRGGGPSRGGGPMKSSVWKESHRGRSAPYPDRRPAPWQPKSPRGRGPPPPPWQRHDNQDHHGIQDRYSGYASSPPPSDGHRRHGNPSPRQPPGHAPGTRRPPPHEDSGRPPPRRYDDEGTQRRFQPHTHHAPEHRGHNPEPHHPPHHHRGSFRQPPPRQEHRAWARSPSPGSHPKPLSLAAERGRGRGRGRGAGPGRGAGGGRPAFWEDRSPDSRGPAYPDNPRPHYPPHPRGNEERKEREFHGRERERWSSSSERERSREQERKTSRHDNSQSRPLPQQPPPSSWKPAGQRPSGPHSAPRSPTDGPPPPRRFPTHYAPRGAPRGHFVPRGTSRGHFAPRGASRGHFVPRGASRGHFTPRGAPRGYLAPRGGGRGHFAPRGGLKRRFPGLLEQPVRPVPPRGPPPPLLKHFQREPSLGPPPRGFGGRGLSLRDKSRLLKNRQFREESVARFKTFPTRGRGGGPPFPFRGGPRALMGRLPPPGPNTRYHGNPFSARRVEPKGPQRNSGPAEQLQQDEGRRPSGQNSPPAERVLPSDLVVVSEWEAPEHPDDGNHDDSHEDGAHGDQVEAKQDLHGDQEEVNQDDDESQDTETETTPTTEDQAPPTKRVVRRPLMSLKTVRPQRRFGQLESIVSKYRLMRQRAPPTQAITIHSIQSQPSTSHRRW